jgi:hypothetical protein
VLLFCVNVCKLCKELNKFCVKVSTFQIYWKLLNLGLSGGLGTGSKMGRLGRAKKWQIWNPARSGPASGGPKWSEIVWETVRDVEKAGSGRDPPKSDHFLYWLAENSPLPFLTIFWVFFELFSKPLKSW